MDYAISIVDSEVRSEPSMALPEAIIDRFNQLSEMRSVNWTVYKYEHDPLYHHRVLQLSSGISVCLCLGVLTSCFSFAA